LPCVLNNHQCLNGATCTNDNVGGYSCTCETGYTGTDCEIRKKKYLIWTQAKSSLTKIKIFILLCQAGLSNYHKIILEILKWHNLIWEICRWIF